MGAISSSILPTVDAGIAFHASGTITAIPGSEVTVFSFTVPLGVTRKINEIFVSSNSPGTFSLESGGSVIASGILYEAEKNIRFKFDPEKSISPSTLVELKFDADAEPTTGCPISGYLSANDF